jgi:uncharacterized protein
MKIKIFFLLLLLPLLSFAQQEVFKGEHFIEVTGTASQEIEPNELYVAVRLREFEENRTKVALEKIEKDFMEALKNAGIDRKRLELADIGSRLDKFRRRDKDAFREKTYQVKLTSAAELEKLLEHIEPVKVDYVDITRISHSELEKMKADVKVKALQAARTKAEYLLKAIGSEVGKPLMIRDWEVDPVQPMIANMRMREQNMNGEFKMEEEPQIGFKKIKLQAQVMAQFEIK